MPIKPAHAAVGIVIVLIAGYGIASALQVAGARADEQIFRDSPEPHYVNLWHEPESSVLQLMVDGFPHRPSFLEKQYLDGEGNPLDEPRSPAHEHALEDGREHVFLLDPPEEAVRIRVNYGLRGQETSITFSTDKLRPSE